MIDDSTQFPELPYRWKPNFQYFSQDGFELIAVVVRNETVSFFHWDQKSDSYNRFYTLTRDPNDLSPNDFEIEKQLKKTNEVVQDIRDLVNEETASTPKELIHKIRYILDNFIL